LEESRKFVERLKASRLQTFTWENEENPDLTAEQFEDTSSQLNDLYLEEEEEVNNNQQTLNTQTLTDQQTLNNQENTELNLDNEMTDQLATALTNIQRFLETQNTQPRMPDRLRETRLVDFPTFRGGDQDPLEWLESFATACDANNVRVDRTLSLVPAYLKGPALTWFKALDLDGVTWIDLDEDHSFEHLFKKQFCTNFRKSQ
jgi:hypothetical protein